MDIKVLEQIIRHAIRGFVSIVMTLRTARAALSNPVRENLSSARDLGGNPGVRKLRQRIWQTAGFVLRPQNLQIRHSMIAEFLRITV